MYEDNGHDRKNLEMIANEYLPKEQREKQAPENLFSLLPFHNDSEHSSNANGNNSSSARNNNNDGIELRPNAKIPFVPGGISYRHKRALNKAGCNVFMTAGQKLQNMLCSKNKTKPDRLERKGVYKYDCKPCQKSYIGETARSFKIRHAEHMKAAQTSKWTHSG